MKPKDYLQYFDLKDEELIFTLFGRNIGTKKYHEEYYSGRWFDNEEEAKAVFNEIKKVVGDRAKTSKERGGRK